MENTSGRPFIRARRHISDKTFCGFFHEFGLGVLCEGVRRFGRPKLRLEDGVDQDVRILEVKNWKKVALNRDEWAKNFVFMVPCIVTLY